MKFDGKITVEAEKRELRENLTMLIIEREDTKPQLSMDWLQGFIWTERNIESTRTTTDQSEKDKNTSFAIFFETKRTNKDTEIKLQLKPGHPPIKQKARPTPYHLQSYVQKEINKLIPSRHLEEKTLWKTIVSYLR